jgi:hypothetical protein
MNKFAAVLTLVSLFTILTLPLEARSRAFEDTRSRQCAADNFLCNVTSQTNDDLYWAFDSKNQVLSFLLDPSYMASIADMEFRQLQSGQIPKAPWSDSFWPLQKGIIARRWLDKNYPDSRSFTVNYNYSRAVPPLSVPLNTMAPSEKYDYLVGDMDFRLTAANWTEGQSTLERLGMVPGWAGICHGWAPASIWTPAPKKAVTVPAFNGTPITFYPSDIKALISLAYATSPPKMYTVGTRCNISHPEENAAGRVTDPRCFDINPGTWHLAVVNEMGLKKRSFVVDTNYDLQIWNYPLYSYRYQYFNPQTLASSTNLSGSMISFADFTIDKFKSFRGTNVKFVVGIEMDISYSIETTPSTKPFQKPKLTTEKILYDLELDEKGTIIGGEWYSNFHPAFIWRFDPDAKPASDIEVASGTAVEWNGTTPIPDSTREMAIVASNHDQPLAAIVETLVRLSQEADLPTTP